MDDPGFDETLRSIADRVAQVIDDPRRATAILRGVRERAPDERLALAFLLRLAEVSPLAFSAALRDAGRADDLIFCLGSSELIGTGLITAGPSWVVSFDQARATEPATALPNHYHASAHLLGEYQRRELLRIAIGDLLGRRSVEQTMGAMSRLAEQCIGVALTIATREAQVGAIAEQFCVLAMGKLGAGELNLSSDIDLIYLFDSDDPGELDAARRLAERLTEILASQCFRVDLRLRPGGSRAPLVSSIEGALNFYESFGQTWERAALLRARPVAGAIMAGQRLINDLARFVYRVYLDFETIRQLRAMKQQIEDELGSADLVRRNLKLGYGGIRELEFIVQALALIYGGRDPRLRTANTLAGLERLAACGYMASARAEALSAAYLFQRNVEHKLQIVADLQTHTLPADPTAVAILAARLGYGKDADAGSRFMRELDAQRALVAEQFRQMVTGDAEHDPTPISTAAAEAWRRALEPEQATAALAALGFTHPAESAGHLEALARGSAYPPSSQNRREALMRLGPLLLDEIRTLADPDLALMNLASFIVAVGARTSFLALLEEHPATRRILLRLFASSAHLSTLFIRHPEMIDTLVRSDLARARHSAAELSSELRDLIEAAPETEERLDAIRAFRHQEFLRVAIADLAGDLAVEEVQAELTLLAETVLREALAQARFETQRRYPIPGELKLCVLAMGRMGAAEMSYNSDLDLIFVYYLPGETAASGREAASRIVQKLIAFIEAATREGYAYKIDLRLRPSGNAGPLVTSLAGFHEYHQQSSALWERQALVRARVVAGDRALGDEVEAARKKFVFGHGLDRAGVEAIAAMRARIEDELGRETPRQLNLKQGPGGLIDIEFLTQMMALRFGRKYPALQARGTIALIRALGACALISPMDATLLDEHYRYFSRLENRLRIEGDQAVTALPTAPERLGPIARRMGYAGPEAATALLGEVMERRARVRELYSNGVATERVRVNDGA
jgi:glutamate-ammonia-ligase adenylyltransferase